MIQVVLPGMTNVWADTTQILLRFDLNIRDKWRLNSDYRKKILFENISILSIYPRLAELTKYFVLSSHLQKEQQFSIYITITFGWKNGLEMLNSHGDNSPLGLQL